MTTNSAGNTGERGHVTRAETRGDDYEHIVWPYRLILPLLFVVAGYVHLKKWVFSLFDSSPKTNFWLVDGVSTSSRLVKEGAARWRALDVTYNFSSALGNNLLSRKFDTFWMQIRNAQAVRNRLKIARRELRLAILSAAKRTQRSVRVLSLAAGSAQGVIDTIAALKEEGVKVEVLLIDQDPTALAYAQVLAERHGVLDVIKTRQGNVLFFNRLTDGFSPDVVEMLGLLDYLRDSTAIPLIRKIRGVLPAGGHFLTCHVHPNLERYFLDKVVDWKMLYRSVGSFDDLMCASGFLGTHFFMEPHGIHSVAVAKKA